MQKQQTCTNQKVESFTIDDLKKCAELVQEQEESKLPKSLGWFTKLMNRFGWHRKYEVLVINKDLFKYNLFKERPEINFKNLNKKK